MQAAQEIHGLAFSADSQKLYSVAGDSIASWDATVREDEGLGPGPNPELFSISGNRAVAFSQDATKVVFNWTRAGVGDFCVWDLARNREVSRLTSDASLAPLFSPDGRLLAHRVRSPQEIVISDVQTGQEWRRIDADKVNATSSAGSFVFSPNSRQLATIYTPKQQIENPGPRRLVVWDLETEKLVASANLNQNGVLLSYSPDGTSLVVASPSLGTKERTLTFLDAGTGQEQRSISIPGTLTPLKIDFAGQVIIAAARSFGRSLVAFSRGDVVLLDLATGHERLRLRGHDGFDCYAVSVDGSRLVLGKHPPSNPGESDLSLWSLKSGRRLMTLKCPGFVQSLAFSSSGHQLAAAIAQSGIGYRKPFYVWDATPLPDAQQADGK